MTSVEARRTRLTTDRDVTDPTFWASQPSRLFGQAAEDAVRQWRWEPGAVRRFEIPIGFAEQNQTMPILYRQDEPVLTRPIKVGGDIKAPLLLAKVEPEYPATAKLARVEGVVILGVVVARDGTVKEAWVDRSIPLLDEAALAAVRQWKYQPTLLNGEPWEVRMYVTVDFTLQ